jgi:hypothetical protein
MGLDILAISNLRLVDPEVKAALDRLPEVSLYLHDDPALTITERSKKEPNYRCDDMANGDYYRTKESEEYDFRAGSYSSYGQFRRELSETFLNSPPEKVWSNPKSYEGQPFYELVDFSDCEGVIGPEVCAKLHKDFVDGRKKFVEEVHSNWSVERYDSWTKALELAKEDGVIIFC